MLRSVYFTRIKSFGEVPEESHSAAACRNLLQSLPLWRTLRCALDLLSVGTTSTEPNFGAGGCSFGKSQGTPPNHTHRSRGGWLPAWQTQPNITAVSNSTAGASCSLPLPQDLAHCTVILLTNLNQDKPFTYKKNISAICLLLGRSHP